MIQTLIFSNLDLFIKILVAGILGASIGFERDVHGRSAGIRTNLLVSLGACLFVIISNDIAVKASISGTMNVDPTRIAAQVVTGIGFLGAGTIIREGFTIKGLTTAACLWVVAAIGMACGYGYYELAVFSTVISIISLLVLQKFENIIKKDTYRSLTISTTIKTEITQIINLIDVHNIKIDYYDFEKNYNTNTLLVRLFLNIHNKGIIDDYFNSIMKMLEDEKIEIHYAKWGHKE
jgi:putative Mg2+ transporter-C (MgtC) family protein